MSKTLARLLTITDVSFLAYWTASLLIQFHLFSVPAEWMYAGYRDPRVSAWNWSFLPLDLLFSAFGLAAVAASRAGRTIWRPLALVSLILTMVAGLMAVGYWILLGEFDPGWFLPNLALVFWPVWFARNLIIQLGSSDP